jgi:hypothetical protein
MRIYEFKKFKRQKMYFLVELAATLENATLEKIPKMHPVMRGILLMTIAESTLL